MRYVIDTVTRGAFAGWGINFKNERVPKFRWSVPLSHRDIVKFTDEEVALVECSKIMDVYPKCEAYVKTIS